MGERLSKREILLSSIVMMSLILVAGIFGLPRFALENTMTVDEAKAILMEKGDVEFTDRTVFYSDNDTELELEEIKAMYVLRKSSYKYILIE